MYRCRYCNEEMPLTSYLNHASSCLSLPSKEQDEIMSNSNTDIAPSPDTNTPSTPEGQGTPGPNFRRSLPQAAEPPSPIFPCPLCEREFPMTKYIEHMTECKNGSSSARQTNRSAIRPPDEKSMEIPNQGPQGLVRVQSTTIASNGIPPARKRFAKAALPPEQAENARPVSSTPITAEVSRSRYSTPLQSNRESQSLEITNTEMSMNNGDTSLAQSITALVGQQFQQHLDPHLREIKRSINDVKRSIVEAKQRMDLLEATMTVKLAAVQEAINRIEDGSQDY